MFKRLAFYLYKTFFPVFERIGIHITPNHYYYPIPDTRFLKSDIWQKRSELVGINMNDQGQCNLLDTFLSCFKPEYDQFPLKPKVNCEHQFYLNNPFYGAVDAEILYCMVRQFKPQTIFEIGSGFSTLISAQAILRNTDEFREHSRLIVNDPYPNKIIKKGFPGLSKLYTRKAEEIPLQDFDVLKENDILFIDSSHVLNIGGDVQYEFLEVLPRLNKGVIVHIHDIFLPLEYPKQWVLKEYRFWQEQYLLQAFLTFNDEFEILWAGHYMHLMNSHKLMQAFKSYQRKEHNPGSFWMRRK